MRQLGARMPELPALEEVPEVRPTRTPADPPPRMPDSSSAPPPLSEEPAAVAAPETEPPVRVPGRTRITERVQPAAPVSASPATEDGPAAPEPVTAQSAVQDYGTPGGRTADPPSQRAAQPHFGDGPRFAELAEQPRADELRFDDVRFRHVRFEDPAPQEPFGGDEETVRLGSVLGLSSSYAPRLSSRARTSIDDEPEHHFPFMTSAVPGLAAVLALGAIVWSGSLRDRMHEQDAAVSQLQQQNQRLEDALDQMGRESPAPAPHANGSAPASLPRTNAQDLVPPPSQPQLPAVPAAQKEAVATPDSSREAGPANGSPSASAPAGKPEVPSYSGQSTPPPMGREPRRANTTGYHPQIVPPYPTTFQPQNVANDRGASQPAPNPGSYAGPEASHAAVTATRPQVTRSTTPVPAPSAAVNTTPYHPPFTVGDTGAHASAAPTTQYTPTSNGAYVSPLAQNIEMVESLQRHSPVPLQEFHAREGLVTRVAPTLGVTVDRVDSGSGSYGLLVRSGATSYQVHGQVNAPVVFTDAATSREYELVVLRIADQQVYGYVKPAR